MTTSKIRASTHGPAGTATKVTLVTRFGTWRMQGLNPLDQFRQL